MAKHSSDTHKCAGADTLVRVAATPPSLQVSQKQRQAACTHGLAMQCAGSGCAEVEVQRSNEEHVEEVEVQLARVAASVGLMFSERGYRASAQRAMLDQNRGVLASAAKGWRRQGGGSCGLISAVLSMGAGTT
jgi:hypothetical protein